MYKDIISKMTTEEKARLLTGEGMRTKAYPQYGIGCIDMSDGPSGVRNSCKYRADIAGGDVAFPTASAQAATWNREIVRKVGNQLGLNCRARGVNMILAPAVNIHRSPLCGRNYEYFSEDPYLAGELGAEYVSGVQEKGVGTSLKHFAANHQENFRGVVNAEIDERTLREIYLPVFETIVKRANPTTIMCAYNKVNGHYCSENKKLLTDILRREWGYDGAVISDWGAVHNVAKALKAGLDLVMPQRKTIVEEVKNHLENGEVTEADIEIALENIISLIKRIEAMIEPPESFDRVYAHKIATEAACDAITLLKNERNILPLAPGKYKKIGVVGCFGVTPVLGGAIESSGGVTVDRESVDSPLDFIREYAGDTEVLYAPVYDELGGNLSFKNMIDIQKLAKECEVLIMFAGNPAYWEIEGEDRDNLDLPRHMIRLAEECSRFCKNTVMVMQTGAPYAPFIRLAEPAAIVQMWYAGEGGGRAIAEVLFGYVNPSGKLPMTFMKEMNTAVTPSMDGRYLNYTEGLFVGYRYYDMHPDKIWYPFGHGLSYTEFEYSDLKVSSEDNLTCEVSFNIRNTGKTAGKEVCQLYVAPLESSVVRPIKELKGFEKVSLEPGEQKKVEIILGRRAFSYYNTNESDWHEESGKYGILVGSSSRDIRLNYVFEVKNNSDYTINRERWGEAVRRELVGE